jgi:hypothetical protein
VARVVYSNRFIAAEGTGNNTYSYTIPDGFRGDIRDFSGTIQGDDIAPVSVFGVANGVNFYYVAVPFQRNISFHWEGRVVLEAGEVVEAIVTSDSALVDVYISGYLLTVP